MARYLEGIALLLVALVPLHAASYLWRARVLDTWHGAVARLAEITTDLIVFICVSEILGSVHLYRIAPMVIALFAVGVVGVWTARRTGLATSKVDDADRPHLIERTSPPRIKQFQRKKYRSTGRSGDRRRRMEHQDRCGLPPRNREH